MRSDTPKLYNNDYDDRWLFMICIVLVDAHDEDRVLTKSNHDDLFL